MDVQCVDCKRWLEHGDILAFGPVVVGALLASGVNMDFDKRSVLANDLLGLPREDLETVFEGLVSKSL